MTYRQHLQDLKKRTIERLSAFSKIENEIELPGGGLVDEARINNLVKAKTEWQNASNEFYGLLFFVAKNKISLDQDIPSNN